MRHWRYLFFWLTILLVSCETETWYRTPSGLEYQLLSSGTKDSIARMGQTVKVRVTQKVRDSVIATTTDKMPLYFMVMPGMHPYNPLEVFDYGLRKGDSVITLQWVDSMLHKKILDSLPRWMKKDDQWISTIKVMDVFTGDSLLQADKAKEAKKVTAIQTALGRQRIEDYFFKNDHYATPSGDVFIETLQDGHGPVADSGKQVSVQFEVRTLKGKLINSTTDTGFHQAGPKSLMMGAGTFPPALEKEVEKMRQGSVEQIYLPSVLLFGANPPEKVKVDDDIIFKIALIEVKNRK